MNTATQSTTAYYRGGNIALSSREINLTELFQKIEEIGKEKVKSSKHRFTAAERALIIRNLEDSYSSLPQVPKDNYLLSVLQKTMGRWQHV